jgi:DNA-binding NarL/FixJ family response regulator
MSSTVPLISVLVVHEQRDMCQLWQRILDLTPGMACPAYATDGTAVLQQIAELAPDVVVLGASLPDTDGLDLTRQILAQHPDTLIIVYSVQDREEAAFAAGAAEYMTLPVSTEELTRTIRQVFKKHHRR